MRVDASDTRRVVVEAFKVEFEDGREDIVYHLDTLEGVEHMRRTPFAMEEGSRYRFVISFRVNQAIVSGLRFRNKVKKTVLGTSDQVVLGSYAPRCSCSRATTGWRPPRGSFTEANTWAGSSSTTTTTAST
jgi:hypothetical protein